MHRKVTYTDRSTYSILTIRRYNPIPNLNRPLSLLASLLDRKTNMSPKICLPVNLPCLSQRTQRLVPTHTRQLVDTNHLAPPTRAHDVEAEMARTDAERGPGIFDVGLFDYAGISTVKRGDVLGHDDVAAEDVCCNRFVGSVGGFGIGFDGFVQPVY